MMFLEEYRGNGSPNYFNLRLVAYGAEALNPLKAKYMNITALKVRIREIKIRTKFPELEDVFISRVESELNQYKDAIDSFSDDDWEALPKAEEHNIIQKKKDHTKTWKNDTAEVARRIWEWWKAHNTKFNYISFLAALLALIQVSSAPVERVFSQLKLILETINDRALRDVIEARLMERINTRAVENKKLKASFDCLLDGSDSVGTVGDLREAHLEGGNFETEDELLEDDLDEETQQELNDEITI